MLSITAAVQSYLNGLTKYSSATPRAADDGTTTKLRGQSSHRPLHIPTLSSKLLYPHFRAPPEAHQRGAYLVPPRHAGGTAPTLRSFKRICVRKHDSLRVVPRPRLYLQEYFVPTIPSAPCERAKLHASRVPWRIIDGDVNGLLLAV
jgi:hypothetical protein